MDLQLDDEARVPLLAGRWASELEVPQTVVDGHPFPHLHAGEAVRVVHHHSARTAFGEEPKSINRLRAGQRVVLVTSVKYQYAGIVLC